MNIKNKSKKKTKSKKKKVANLHVKISKAVPINKLTMSNRNKQIQNLVNYRDSKQRRLKINK